MKKQVVVAGASGLVGRGAIRAFQRDPDFEVIAVSRRKPEGVGDVRFIALDLFDAEACVAALSQLSGVTHVVFAALYETSNDLLASWVDEKQIEGNDRMLRNFFEPLSAVAKSFEHFVLLQGTKAYGAHVQQIPLPAREDRDELKSQPNFYWNQEGYLRDKQRGKGWSFSISRPQVIFGDAIGAALNPVVALGAYGAILKERGEPLYFPSESGPAIFEGVDADLVGRAIYFGATNPAGRNQAFNVTNGDVMGWRYVWPAVADALGMKPGPDRPMKLGAELPQRAGEWDALRKKHNLTAPSLAEFAGKSLDYLDLLMGFGATPRVPTMVSTIKLRQAGFHEVMDSEVMLRNAIAALQARRLLPPR